MIRQSLPAIRQQNKGKERCGRQCKGSLSHHNTPPLNSTLRTSPTQEHHQTMRWIAALAVASVAVGLASGQARACQTGFIEVGGECLAFLSSYGTWQSQLESCSMAGGSLAKVIDDLHNAVYQHIIDIDLTDECFWIGGSDSLKEGAWKWESDQSDIPLGAPHWDPCEQEPDGGTLENYLAICPKMYYFKDYPGDQQHHAICQIF